MFKFPSGIQMELNRIKSVYTAPRLFRAFFWKKQPWFMDVEYYEPHQRTTLVSAGKGCVVPVTWTEDFKYDRIYGTKYEILKLEKKLLKELEGVEKVF